MSSFLIHSRPAPAARAGARFWRPRAGPPLQKSRTSAPLVWRRARRASGAACQPVSFVRTSRGPLVLSNKPTPPLMACCRSGRPAGVRVARAEKMAARSSVLSARARPAASLKGGSRRCEPGRANMGAVRGPSGGRRGAKRQALRAVALIGSVSRARPALASVPRAIQLCSQSNFRGRAGRLSRASCEARC